MSNNKGKISQIIGPVIDVIFENTNNGLPKIYDALEIQKSSGEKMIVECQQHVGENTIRAIAMDSTDGLKRGMEVEPTGNPILMPIGDDIKGRLFWLPFGLGQLSNIKIKLNKLKNEEEIFIKVYFIAIG